MTEPEDSDMALAKNEDMARAEAGCVALLLAVLACAAGVAWLWTLVI